MSKTKEICLKYTDSKGKECSSTLKIKKIYNWAQEEYDRINEIIEDVKELAMDIAELEKEIDIVIHRLEDDWFEKRKELRRQRKNLMKEMRQIKKSALLQERFKLISGILKDNQINREEFHTFDFWNSQVEPLEITAFLHTAVYKDLINNQEGSKNQTGGK